MVGARRFIIPALDLVLCSTSDAWMTVSRARYNPAVRHRAGLKATSTALHAQNGDDRQDDECQNGNEHQGNDRLRVALEAARDADRRYGLCTPASDEAWQIVDDIFSSSQARHEAGKNAKREDQMNPPPW